MDLSEIKRCQWLEEGMKSANNRCHMELTIIIQVSVFFFNAQVQTRKNRS